MALRVVGTEAEILASTPLREAVQCGLALQSSVLVLVPSFKHALQLQRELAKDDVGLGVTVTTPKAWVRERWEAWGDGRAIASSTVLSVLAYELLRRGGGERGLELSSGMVHLLTSMVGQALPWLPRMGDGSVDAAACRAAGLTDAETELVSLALRLGALLQEHGYLAVAEASTLVPGLLEDAGVALPAVVCAGFSSMTHSDRQLVEQLGRLTDLCFVARVGEGPAYDAARTLASSFGPIEQRAASNAERVAERVKGLRELRELLFSHETLKPSAVGPVSLLLASGPRAEAELVACAVCDEAHAPSAGGGVVVVVPDVERARRELVPKLVARGVSVRMTRRQPLRSCAAAVAFLQYAQAVARLAQLTREWPKPVEGIDGPLAQLGSMDWWPPSEIVDFLLSDLARMEPSRAWALDARWRGNRLLTPQQVLDALQSERVVSGVVARATTELLRGHIGTAAARLLASRLGQDEGHANEASASDEAAAALQSLAQLATTVRNLNVLADVDRTSAAWLVELVRLFVWSADGVGVVVREEHGTANGPCVRIVSAEEATALPAGSADVVVACGLTTVESPVGATDDLLTSLLALLGIEPMPDPMAQARARFHALVSLPKQRLVLERALHDADAKLAYPSVMLGELLSVYGIRPQTEPDEIPLPVVRRAETDLGANLAPMGKSPQPQLPNNPAPEGSLTERSRELVLVPQEGSERLPDDRPILSASQVETYLDCPYKWFSLRRLRLGTVDAGHSNMEMGTFAHRVLEVTHGELLARALERANPGVSRAELLERIALNPVCRVEGSRVTEQTLAEAQALLDAEFELHSQHMRMVKNPRPAQQVLIPHNVSEEEQEARLHGDLRSAMAYQLDVLAGFEPRLFEWGFGKHGNLVPYAGAYFTGTVDRVDVSPHGTAVIIDYKHKSPAGFASEYDAIQDGVLEGEALPRRVQSLIYAQVVRRAFGERLRLVGTVYLSTKAPHALAGAADAACVEQVFGKLSSRRLPRVSVPAQDGKPGMYGLLDRTEELVAQAVARMLEGDVEARPRDAASCDFCPVMHCERRVAR